MTSELAPTNPIVRDGEPLTREGAVRLARIARVLVDAALANECVRTYLNDLTPWHGIYGLWTTERVKTDPPIRLEFEHAYALGGLGECLAACENKPTFGKLIGVLPVEPDDPVGETRIIYVFKDSSPYNRRVLQRKWMKKQLAHVGRQYRPLVTQAMRETKGYFLKRYAVAGVADVLKLAFGPDMDPGRFWRVVKGKEWIEIPKAPVQGTLFDDGEE